MGAGRVWAGSAAGMDKSNAINNLLVKRWENKKRKQGMKCICLLRRILLRRDLSWCGSRKGIRRAEWLEVVSFE
jgi:hypothetical protein